MLPLTNHLFIPYVSLTLLSTLLLLSATLSGCASQQPSNQAVLINPPTINNPQKAQTPPLLIDDKAPTATVTRSNTILNKRAVSCSRLRDAIKKLERQKTQVVLNPNDGKVHSFKRDKSAEYLATLSNAYRKQRCQPALAIPHQPNSSVNIQSKRLPRLNFDQCYQRCKSLTERSNAQCFDACK